MTLDQVIARNIKILRTKFGLNQEQLAERIGVQRVSVSQYETAERRIPTKDLEKIANFFNVDLEAILEENLEDFSFSTAFAFRADNLTKEDYLSLERFKEVFHDFCKLSRLMQKNELILD